MQTPFSTIKLGSRTIGTGHPLFVMADMGLTHGGDIERALHITSKAAEFGADAIKIQVVDYDMLMADRSAKYTYQTADGPREQTLYDIFREIWLEPSEITRLANHARSLGIELIATADYESAVDILEDAGVNCHKIDTWSVTHKRLIQKIGSTGKPMMLDMGMSTQHGLANLLDWYHMAGGSSALILHDFRSDNPEAMHFRNIPQLQALFGYPVGFTPQGRDAKFDHLAIGLGANFIEKRITIDRTTPKNGHFKALDLDEWAAWIADIRILEKALGAAYPSPQAGDLKNAQRFMKSLYVNADLAVGDIVTDAHLESRRPGFGLSSARIDEIVGRPLKIAAAAGTMLSEDHF